jgi:transposase
MKAYSEDLRRKIVQAVGGGMGKSEVAPTLGVSLSSIKRYVGMAHQGRSLTPKKPPGLRPNIDEQGKRILQADLKERPAATRPLPSRNAESSCSAWGECELETRRSPGQ